MCIWPGFNCAREGRRPQEREFNFRPGSEFKRGEASAKAIRRGKKGEPKANRKRNSRKNKSPKPGKVVGSFKGRHHALIDSCIYIGIEAGDEINAGLNAQKP